MSNGRHYRRRNDDFNISQNLLNLSKEIQEYNPEIEQIKEVKIQCIRSKKFGLEAYNLCIGELKLDAEDGTLWDGPKNPPVPKSNIAKLESLTVRIYVI